MLHFIYTQTSPPHKGAAMPTQTLRIGDVSHMFHLSDQMIRYYEKNGVIKPTRSKEGNFRTYTMEDVFLLFDAMRYKEWNMNIRDIDEVIHGDYFNILTQKLTDFDAHLQAEIARQSLLQTRISSLNHKFKLCRYNIGKYFIFEQPAYHLYFCGTSEGDQYDMQIMPEAMTAQIFAAENISYFDVWVEFHAGGQLWWYALDDRYHRALGLRDTGERKKTPVQLCLSTFIEMGQMGSFSDVLLDPVYAYMRDNGYSLDGAPRGLIIGRGCTEDGKFSRIMELQIPIRT